MPSMKILIVLLVVSVKLLVPQSEIIGFMNRLDLLNGYLLHCGLIVYMLLLMLPYFPGIEIGIALMILFKEDGTLLSHSATVASLATFYMLSGELFTKNKKELPT